MLLIVNVASNCGYTDVNYKGLQVGLAFKDSLKLKQVFQRLEVIRILRMADLV